MADNTQTLKILLEAKDQASSVLNNFSKNVGGLQKSLTSVAGLFGVALGGAAVVGFLNSSVKAFEESQRVIAQTEAVIKSTGGVAGVTTQEIMKMAKAIQDTTAISDESAQAGLNMLLTFTRIGKDVLPQASQALIDMATAMNGGATPSAEQLRDTAIQLGKALNDPIMGVQSLRRVGVMLSDDQQKLVKQLIDTNRGMEAQKVILDELSKEFGGSASAQVNTFAGQVAQLRNQINDAQEIIGQALVPALSYLMEGIRSASGAGRVFIEVIKFISASAIILIGIVKELGNALAMIFQVGVQAITGQWDKIGQTVRGGLQNMGTEVVNAFNKIDDVYRDHTTEQTSIIAGAFKQQDFDRSAESAKIAKSLADETRTYKEEVAKRKKAYTESLADIVRAHIQTATNLKKQIKEETASYKAELAQQVKDHADAMFSMKQSHEDRASDIQTQIDEELANGLNADQQKLAQLRIQLTRENRDYDQAKQKEVESDAKATEDIKTQHDQKLTDYQSRLKIETDILSAHKKEVAKVENMAVEDDITRLKRKFDEENKQAEVDHKRKLADIIGHGNELGTASGLAINDALKGTQPKIDATMKSIGSTAASNFASPIIDVLKQLRGLDGGKAAFGDKGYSDFIKKYDVKSHQHGGYVDAPTGQAVPAILHGGERIIPRNGTDVNGGPAAGTININFTGDITVDSPERIRELAEAVNRILGRQNELAAKGLSI